MRACSPIRRAIAGRNADSRPLFGGTSRRNRRSRSRSSHRWSRHEDLRNYQRSCRPRRGTLRRRSEAPEIRNPRHRARWPSSGPGVGFLNDGRRRGLLREVSDIPRTSGRSTGLSRWNDGRLRGRRRSGRSGRLGTRTRQSEVGNRLPERHPRIKAAHNPLDTTHEAGSKLEPFRSGKRDEPVPCSNHQVTHIAVAGNVDAGSVGMNRQIVLQAISKTGTRQEKTRRTIIRPKSSAHERALRLSNTFSMEDRRACNSRRACSY